jgi:catechol 2,3-dioxygenase-like lactoylglutathione lyase family enzyme
MDIYFDTRKVGNVIISLLRKPTINPKAEDTSKNIWRLEHIGFVVKDTNKAIDVFKSSGFTILMSPILLYKEIPNAPKIKLCLLQKSSFIIELFEQVGGKALWGDYLEKYGEGINHISFAVDDLEKETAKIIKKGVATANIDRNHDGSLGEVYFDTCRVGNVYLALYQGKPRLNYEDNIRFIAQLPGIMFKKVNS